MGSIKPLKQRDKENKQFLLSLILVSPAELTKEGVYIK